METKDAKAVATMVTQLSSKISALQMAFALLANASGARADLHEMLLEIVRDGPHPGIDPAATAEALNHLATLVALPLRR